MTGEQESVRKYGITDLNNLKNHQNDIINDYDLKNTGNEFENKHKCHRGAVVDDGEAIMKVTRVGKHTEYGKLHIELTNTESRESPLQGFLFYNRIILIFFFYK